ncbi:LysM peptidoglycan-binding domain-containing protein [Lentzea sp. NEAU-D7]|uniref:LysM peptidoglycan-binding domain-containing protein n=1 Tax=Lentzea sp. NEAU-D7 TaxID=2994667 RepID=UPI00224AB0CB|nr:LysM peptidoglycan-binding domain-containing protein [Lentzea sp. NEAU-D7]MCX2954577.1 LysM peptidoglycan-binding domain-containing protein [Lentzea sp. NEAU-D7]
MTDYASDNNVHAMWRCIVPPAIGAVVCQFNPDKISISRSNIAEDLVTISDNAGKPAGSLGTVLRKSPLSTITVNDVLFRGIETKPFCDQLLAWMSPNGGVLGQALGAAYSLAFNNVVGKLPPVVFQWGPPMMGFWYTVVLTNVTINYLRFNNVGVPIRAKVSVTMKEQPDFLGSLPTNPTSGGLSGRRGHTVTDGDSLQSLATANYGSPGRWRQVAEANGIDDPLRVRSGAVVYLPNPDELHRGDKK